MEKRKIDLKKHASEKASKWYLVKLIFYIICITVLAVIMYFQYRKMIEPKETNSTEIQGVTIEVED